MLSSVWACRVCASTKTSLLFAGEYAAFFQLRADIDKDPFLQCIRRDFLPGRHYPLIWRVLRRVQRHWPNLFSVSPATPFRTNMIYCHDCHSATPAHDFSFKELCGLYDGYRQEKYNADRISVEESYADLAALVGSDPRELVGRNAAADAFFSKYEDVLGAGKMLDYGGSDGRFLTPSCLARYELIDIFEPSSVPLHPSVPPHKVRHVAEPVPASYRFVSCMHVLEHVGNPRGFVEELVSYLEPGGVLYIETPQEMSDAMRQDFDAKAIDAPVCIHEHLNKFYAGAVSKLISSLPSLELIDEGQDVVDSGWCQFTAIRVLARKL